MVIYSYLKWNIFYDAQILSDIINLFKFHAKKCDFPDELRVHMSLFGHILLFSSYFVINCLLNLSSLPASEVENMTCYFLQENTSDLKVLACSLILLDVCGGQEAWASTLYGP